MKNKKSLSKGKRLAMLSIISAMAGMFEKIKTNAEFALSSEKHRAEKSDLRIAASVVKNFFEEMPEMKIHANGITILGTCDKICQSLIKNSYGNDKIRCYNAMGNSINEQLELVNKEEHDDSQRLFNVLK